ncbi:hypothetical protein BS78_08G103300 [Paspalum vaginatum]|nr:hypothetical protein BS78_08G103300 [Paspalum vaginatum]
MKVCMRLFQIWFNLMSSRIFYKPQVIVVKRERQMLVKIHIGKGATKELRFNHISFGWTCHRIYCEELLVRSVDGDENTIIEKLCSG